MHQQERHKSSNNFVEQKIMINQNNTNVLGGGGIGDSVADTDRDTEEADADAEAVVNSELVIMKPSSDVRIPL